MRDVSFGSDSDFRQCPRHVRYAPDSGLKADIHLCPFGARTDITRVIKTAGVEPVRTSQPRCPLDGKKVLGVFGVFNFSARADKVIE
jgi:hypothetical protein